jgi:hypothetical protein
MASTQVLTGRPLSASTKLLLGFVAGFLATLLFHQPVLSLLTRLGVAKANVYSMTSTAPLGVPQVISLAFWGGVWGIVFALIEGHFPRGAAYWICALVFGAIFPTLCAWFLVAPMKGQAMAAGWDLSRMIVGPIVNGAWGLGTALLLAIGYRAWR